MEATPQWVLGKAPREAPSLVSEDQFADLDAIQDQVGLRLRRHFSIWVQVRECNVHFSEVTNQSLKCTQ